MTDSPNRRTRPPLAGKPPSAMSPDELDTLTDEIIAALKTRL